MEELPPPTSAEVSPIHDFTALSDDCGATGSATVTFTATDDCGNASTTSAIFTIEDTTAPDITTDPEGEVYQRDAVRRRPLQIGWLISEA